MLQGDCTRPSILVPATNLCARVLFEPLPETPLAVQAMQDAMSPRMQTIFGIESELQNSLAVALDHDGSLVGMSGVVVDAISITPGKVARIAYVAVEPNARRCGLASHLVSKCEERAALWGHREIYLFVIKGNTPAFSLYRKLGYEPLDPEVTAMLPCAGRGREDGQVHMASRELIYMKKQLRPRCMSVLYRCLCMAQGRRIAKWMFRLCNPSTTKKIS